MVFYTYVVVVLKAVTEITRGEANGCIFVPASKDGRTVSISNETWSGGCCITFCPEGRR